MIQKDDIIDLQPKYEKTFEKYEDFLTSLTNSEALHYEKVSTSDLEESTADNMPILNNPKLTNYYQSFLSEQVTDQEYIINLYFGTNSGAMYLHNIPEADVDLTTYNAKETDWYNKAVLSSENVIWTDPYIDPASEKPTITLAKAILNESGAILGVAAIDFDMYLLAKNMRQDVLITMIVTMAVSILVGLVIVILFVRLMNYNISVIKSELIKLANGDLSGDKISVKGKDEFKQLADAMNQMKDNLYAMINKVMMATGKVMQQSSSLNQSSDQVKEGSEQIAATMEELSSGSESQANHASDLAIAMEEYSKKVKLVAESGSQVADESQNVVNLSQGGTR
ncbi:methyl-accepting chemotaxis protein [Gracilibacillus boraciitolerans JCM 21714]|uniref:Methyl-accepting chemotaxis protein n=1 Tax=Gracilibacillus boraciitolerans JCM 21714 TaxID=1298598 RepID=W4VN70_9BACI|nr:methyl-accepting chemotaxis protein [Gracilibacillus boraciitolerans]GAE94860.1 methyl-accepting chemotaxis protein [Gracilibacillus boraciitolerans JCM 21714]